MRGEIFILIMGMAVVTYLTRVSFLCLFQRISLPEQYAGAFRFIPVGILTAIVIPGIFVREGQLAISAGNHFILAGIFSALAAAKWKNIFAPLAAGMTVIILLQTLPR